MSFPDLTYEKKLLGANLLIKIFAMIWLGHKPTPMLGQEIQERESGPCHPATLHDMTNLAAQTDPEDLGDLQQAADINRSLLERQQSSLGSMHADTLYTKSKLALQLASLGKHQESADLHTEVSELDTEYYLCWLPA